MKVEISHPDKLLFPDDGITKGDLAAYYEEVARWMLPHVRDRPVSMQRFPDGISGKGFFHKDAPDYFPDWIARAELPKAGGKVTHVLIRNADTLRYLANQNTITPHVFLSRADRPHQPDRLVFDLDPEEGSDFATVRRAARWTADLLAELELVPFAQVTGSKGIHIWTPLRRRANTDEVRAFANDAAELLAEAAPRRAHDRVPQGEARRTHPRRRSPQRVRADGRAAIRGAPSEGCAGGDPDHARRAVRRAPATGSLDAPERAAPSRDGGRSLGGHPGARSRPLRSE